MTSFDPTDLTANPVPSGDFRVGERNAQDLDKFMNQTGTFENRSGVTLDTLTEALQKIGYQPPVAYASGISFTINDRTKTIERGSIVYAPLGSEIPFTTSGTWASDDEDKFFAVQTGRDAFLGNPTVQSLTMNDGEGGTNRGLLGWAAGSMAIILQALTGGSTIRLGTNLDLWAGTDNDIVHNGRGAFQFRTFANLAAINAAITSPQTSSCVMVTGQGLAVYTGSAWVKASDYSTAIT